MKFQEISDKVLYKKCVIYGKQILQARRKFIGLLPEVYKRRLYARKGFGSIFEFAAKLAGVSHEQVSRVLQLERKYEDKPLIHAALVEGEISVNKLARIASIATSDNEQALVEKAKILSSRSLEVFVRDTKMETIERFQTNFPESNSNQGSTNHNGLMEPFSGCESVHVHNPKWTQTSKLNLDSDLESELVAMQQKGIDVNAFLREALRKRKEEIENEKEKLAEAQKQELEEKAVIGMPGRRYIPVKIRKILFKEHGNNCTHPNCDKPAEQIHHENRFAKFRLHDARYLKPLCKAHHEIEHAGDNDKLVFESS